MTLINANIGAPHISSISYQATIATLLVAVTVAMLQIAALGCDDVKFLTGTACYLLVIVMFLTVLHCTTITQIFADPSIDRPLQARLHQGTTLLLLVGCMLVIAGSVVVHNALLRSCGKTKDPPDNTTMP